VGGNTRMSMSSTGGSLHGTWSSESIISASDRRLKHKVEPLQRTLLKGLLENRPNGTPRPPAGGLTAAPGLAAAIAGDAVPPGATVLEDGVASSGTMAAGVAATTLPPRTRTSPSSSSPSTSAAEWVLRELRPVSFAFRKGPESKFVRYGFVAQEVERVLPDLVHTRGETKHVAYQDLLAVLTLAGQAQHERVSAQEARAQQRQQRLAAQDGRLERLRLAVGRLAAKIGRWETLSRPAGQRSRRLHQRRSR
jgi:hypothetical protein